MKPVWRFSATWSDVLFKPRNGGDEFRDQLRNAVVFERPEGEFAPSVSMRLKATRIFQSWAYVRLTKSQRIPDSAFGESPPVDVLEIARIDEPEITWEVGLR